MTGNCEEGHPALKGLYILHEELGSGGFGKVKRATHLLTGQSVAIKIIDKKAIGHDLPRVKTEMEALRTLSHQNICRLYHYIETSEKFFIVMEYCSGGEMFDYIVRKERLEESEARHFFRQLLQAIAYVHSMGFAHRDLKPENLLLTEDLHLKLIDFGLCARPGGPGLSHNQALETCCGSPAYAAPELIQGRPYFGNQADVWSMGILLYALLCGALPFEEDNMQALYRKIAAGRYYEPDYLSASSKELMRKMLQVEPERRITVSDLLRHPWLNYNYKQQLKWQSIYDKNLVDEDVANEIAYHYATPFPQMVAKIKEWRFDYLTATYYLLLALKRRGEKFALPPPKVTGKEGVSNIISSPTIHVSLEDNLDRSGLSDSDDNDSDERGQQNFSSQPSTGSELTIAAGDKKKKKISASESGSSLTDEFEQKARISKPLSPERDKKNSYTRAVNAMLLQPPTAYTGRSPQQRVLFDRVQQGGGGTRDGGSSSIPSTPNVKDKDREGAYATYREHQYRAVTRPLANLGFDSAANSSSDKENQAHGQQQHRNNAGGTFSRVTARAPVRIGHDDNTRRYLYTTPQRPAVRGAYSPDSIDDRRPCVRMRSQRPTTLTSPPSLPRPAGESPSDMRIGSGSGNASGSSHTPRSTQKTPRLRTRMFTSLERKAGKVINMLTPRKVRNNESPQVLRSVKNVVNVSMTSSDSPAKVRDELINVFQKQEMKYEVDGWKISARQKDKTGGSMTVELEVVMIETYGKVGIRRKRLNGNAFLYKKVCEQILAMAQL